MGMLRTRIQWTIPGAGTAQTLFHWLTIGGNAPVQADFTEAWTKTNQFRTDIRSLLPSQVTAATVSDVEEINEQSGMLLGVLSGGTAAAQPGTATSTAPWAAAVGGVISWSTAGIRKNRRVRGRTFIVPMSSTAFDTDGTLTAGTLTTLNTVSNSLMTGGTNVQLAVWCRPTSKGATDADAFNVMARKVPDMGAILTSRRS